MCTTCGCSDNDGAKIIKIELGEQSNVHVQTGSEHRHAHDHASEQEHGHGHCSDQSHAPEQEHGHGHCHAHSHASEHEHGHGHCHAHSHAPEHEHGQAHSHASEHEHGHGHCHAHSHVSEQEHGHGHCHAHSHASEQEHGRAKISVEEKILAKNDALASSNRRFFARHKILALNLVSAPGAGKTSFLEKIVPELKKRVQVAVIEGDQATTKDAERIAKSGCRVVQINTGAGCHLDAEMLAKALIELDPENGSILFIENVGNLVCPALFDLGESAKVLLLSVTEGEDKPLKYPHMFRACDLLIVNKTDLLPHLKFDLAKCIQNALDINPKLKVLQVSAESGEGLERCLECLEGLRLNLEIVG